MRIKRYRLSAQYLMELLTEGVVHPSCVVNTGIPSDSAIVAIDTSMAFGGMVDIYVTHPSFEDIPAGVPIEISLSEATSFYPLPEAALVWQEAHGKVS